MKQTEQANRVGKICEGERKEDERGKENTSLTNGCESRKEGESREEVNTSRSSIIRIERTSSSNERRHEMLEEEGIKSNNRE